MATSKPAPEGERTARDYVVCDLEELPPGTMKLVPVGKFGVGVYNVGGVLHAITNYCPHEGGPLCLGRVQGTSATSSVLPDRMTYVREGGIIRCPWHSWEFDLTTGQSLGLPRRGIRTYEVRVDQGQVILTR